MTTPASAPPPRSFTPQERALLSAKQAELQAKRQADRAEFHQVLRQTEQPRLVEVLRTDSSQVAPAPKVNRSKAVLDLPSPTPSSDLVWNDVSRPVQRALDAAEPVLTAQVRPRARPRAQRVYHALITAAYSLIDARRQSAHTTTYTWFTVLDVLPVVTGLSAATCERALADLRETGLIATRRWYTRDTFLDADTGERVERQVCGGVFLAVLLQPAPDRRAHLRTHELPEAPRDLAADRKVGRTAWQCRHDARTEVRESSFPEKKEFDITLLIQWTLTEANTRSVPVGDSLTSAESAGDVVWGLSALLSQHPAQREPGIERAARSLTRVYRDPGSFKHYCRILHRAVQMEFADQPAFRQLQHAMQRVLVDMTEGHLHRPGAKLVRELQRAGWWDAVYRAA